MVLICVDGRVRIERLSVSSVNERFGPKGAHKRIGAKSI